MSYRGIISLMPKSVAQPFTMEVNTTLGAGTTFTMPFSNVGGYVYDNVIDWGDGNTSTITSATDPALTHTYSVGGTYTIKVTGRFDGFSTIDVSATRTKITKIVNWGANKFKRLALFNSSNLDITASDTPDLSLLTSLTNTLTNLPSLVNSNGSVGNWNVSNVTTMFQCFYGTTAFNKPLNWNCSSCTNMDQMFYGNTSFNSAVNFTNTGIVTSMDSMFYGASNFNQPVSFNTNSVTSMSQMFRGCTNFNSSITFTSTANVTNMFAMFYQATNFNQPLAFNTASVTTMNSMFGQATAFNQNIGSWNVANVLNFNDFMFGKTAANYSATNLDAIYNGWSAQAVKPNLNINFNTIKYTAASSAGRAILTGAPNNWVITDGGI